MDSPGGQYWCQMLLEHLLCTRLAGGRLMGHSSWPKQLVPQEMAGNSQIQGVRYGIPHSLKVPADLGTAQEIIIVQEMGCQGATVQVQRPMARTQQIC